MANNYAVVANIFPGNVTIVGNLTVSGRTIRLGPGPRFARIQNLPNNQVIISENEDAIAITQDDGVFPGWVIGTGSGFDQAQMQRTPPGLPAAFNTRLLVNDTELQGVVAVLRLGAASPFVRLYKRTAGQLGLSYNLASDEATRDNGAGLACMLFGEPGPVAFSQLLINPAGGSRLARVDGTIAQDGTAVTVTGTVAETTTRSKVIPGNTLGADGALLVELNMHAVTQGGVSTVVRVKLGGIIVGQAGHTATGQYRIFFELWNANATNAQEGWFWELKDNSFPGGARIVAALDTTLDQTLSVTIQPGAATDNWVDRGWKVHGFAASGSAL